MRFGALQVRALPPARTVVVAQAGQSRHLLMGRSDTTKILDDRFRSYLDQMVRNVPESAARSNGAVRTP